jgi:hypothetical protein
MTADEPTMAERAVRAANRIAAARRNGQKPDINGWAPEDIPLPPDLGQDEPIDGAMIDGAALLDRLHATHTKYVAYADRFDADAVTLWTAATHGINAWQHATRLVFSSPQRRCGKTRALDITAGMSHDPLLAGNASVAAIFRSIDKASPPTLIFDECDAIFGTKIKAEQNEDLRALLNNGFGRGRPTLRCVGPQQTPTEFETFAMAALAGIGTLPDTITDRAVNIKLQRRGATDTVAKFRQRRDGPVLNEIRDALAAWVGAYIDKLEAAEPDLPVDDREADAWEPLYRDRGPGRGALAGARQGGM